MTTPKCVYDYHQLRQLAPPLGPPGPPHYPHFPACDYVFVSGYPDPQNSGLQGFFEWRPHSTDADNGGTVIKPASIQPADKGRWHRVFEGAISVKWFGAIGDGNSHPLSTRYASLVAAQADYPFVTSLNDEIDWAALQAAIAFVNLMPAPAAAQYLIEFPPGTYKVTSTLTPVIANNITFRGSTADACTIAGAAGATLFQWGDASHAVSGGGLQHLGISYAGLTPTNAVAIHQYNATNQLFEDIRIANVWTLYVCGTNTTDSGACTFNGVRGYCYYNGSATPGYALFKLIRVGGISLRNISVEVGGGGPNSPAFPSIEDGNYGTAHMLTSGSPGTARRLPPNSGGSAGGINFLEIVTDTGHGIDTVYMSDILAQQFTCGVYVYCQNSSAAEFILATNCVWDNCGQTGVLIGGDNSGCWTISNVLLSNCICTGWDGYGVALKQDATGFGYISNVTISGCYIHDTGLEGIYIGSQCRNVDISNPKVENPNRFSGGTAAGIRVQTQASDLSITGGTVGGNFNGTTTFASIGLAIEPGCRRFAVSGGTYSGITYGLSLGASGDAYDIQGTFKGGTAPLQIVGTDAFGARNRRIRLANQLAGGDGTTDDRAALAAGDAAVPYGFHHRLERGMYHIAGALTFSNELEFGVGAVLDPGSQALGFQSAINVPPMQQIFLPSATLVTLQGNREVYAGWFGAKGDGTADDTGAIQAALEAVALAGGGTVFFPIGVYSISSTLKVSGAGTQLSGAGRKSIIRATIPTFHLVTVYATQVGFFDLAFEGAAIDATRNFFAIFTSDAAPSPYGQVVRCYFGGPNSSTGINNAIKLDTSSDYWAIRENLIERTIGNDGAVGVGYGVLLGQSSFNQIYNNRFIGNKLTVPVQGRHAVYASGGSSHNYIRGNYIENYNSSGVPVYSKNGQPPCDGNVIESNYIIGRAKDAAESAAIEISGNVTNTRVLSNTIFSDGGVGIMVNGFATGGCKDNIVSANRILAPGTFGIVVDGATRTEVSGNTVVDASQASPGTYPAIQIQAYTGAPGMQVADGTVVVANTLTGTSTPPSHRCGMTLNPTVPVPTNTLVRDNNVKPRGSLDIELNGVPVSNSESATVPGNWLIS